MEKFLSKVLFLLLKKREKLLLSNEKHIKDNNLRRSLIPARKEGELALVDAEEIDLMDVSPSQMISIATSLIPFLEHDDANHSLNGFEHDETSRASS